MPLSRFLRRDWFVTGDCFDRCFALRPFIVKQADFNFFLLVFNFYTFLRKKVYLFVDRLAHLKKKIL